MSDSFMGEIKIVSFGYAPKNWALCNGQIVAIAQNQAPFSLLGTQFGGDGIRTFGLPNLQGRLPLHRGTLPPSGPVYTIGEQGGEAMHALLTTEMPSHTHIPTGSSGAPTAPGFTNNLWATATENHYTTVDDAHKTNMNPAAIGNTGSNQGHENRPPYLVLNFIICLYGIYPSRN